MDEARAKRLTLIACILGSAIVFVDQTVVMIASELGTSSAPNAPCSARAPMSTSIEGAMAQASEAPPKPATPIAKIRRRP